MTYLKTHLYYPLALILMLAETPLMGQTNLPSPQYNIYSGNTHAHTIYTESHGSQLAREPGHKNYMSITSENVSIAVNTTLKPDWRKYQGPPSAHYALAKSNGYDFYVTTDHSQEAVFHPTSPDNTAWVATLQEANVATDSTFVALTGYEHSENNGPGGRGHINVINSSAYLNALEPGVDLPNLYEWLKTVPANGEGPVVATFNHPGKEQYNNWAHRDPQITDIITMLEVINSNKRIHYEGFVNALDKGWKVSPVSGNDNHGLSGISSHTSRTFVLATDKTKVAVLDAMKNRRTYASLDQNIQCKYTVNDTIMGSTLNRPESFKFDIVISDPDTNNPKNKITKIDIVKDGGVVVQTYNPTPAHAVHWNPTIHDSENTYFFVRVWNAGGGDGADLDKPVAWLAPVWTGR